MSAAWLDFYKREVEAESLLIMWLGQSGFAVKSSEGDILFIDPYLTDTISNGYRPYLHARMLPPVVECSEVSHLRAILYTHDHMDHMDPNTAVQLLWGTDAAVIASPPLCQTTLKEKFRIPETRLLPLAEYASHKINSVTITATPAHHSVGALGFILEIGALCLYFCGDTQLFYTMKDIAARWDIDTAFLCFNGQGGNMDISSAVSLAGMLHVREIVPTHYGMYVDNNAEPVLFKAALDKHFHEIGFHVMQPGIPEVFTVRHQR